MNTPRTDAARFHLVCYFDQGGEYAADSKRADDGEWVPADVCTQMEIELNQWKANHDNQVKLKSLLINRPDLGDRAPRIQRMLDENKHLKDELAAMTALADRLAEALDFTMNGNTAKDQTPFIDASREALAAYENHKKKTP